MSPKSVPNYDRNSGRAERAGRQRPEESGTGGSVRNGPQICHQRFVPNYVPKQCPKLCCQTMFPNSVPKLWSQTMFPNYVTKHFSKQCWQTMLPNNAPKQSSQTKMFPHVSKLWFPRNVQEQFGRTLRCTVYKNMQVLTLLSHACCLVFCFEWFYGKQSREYLGN